MDPLEFCRPCVDPAPTVPLPVATSQPRWYHDCSTMPWWRAVVLWLVLISVEMIHGVLRTIFLGAGRRRFPITASRRVHRFDPHPHRRLPFGSMAPSENHQGAPPGRLAVARAHSCRRVLLWAFRIPAFLARTGVGLRSSSRRAASNRSRCAGVLAGHCGTAAAWQAVKKSSGSRRG